MMFKIFIMAFFVLSSDVTIGNFQFSGVNEVRIKRSIHSYGDSAFITIPSISKIINANKKSATVVTTGTLFNYGDPVTIKLGYNGNLQTEFQGFVKHPGLGMPLVVECEGYAQLLRDKVAVSGDYRKTPTSAAKLLAQATSGTGITVLCPVDFPLVGIKLTKANGLQIIDYIKEASDHTLSIFFIQPNVLWCGLTYSAYVAEATGTPFNLPTVNYRLGYNCLKDNGLKQRIPTERVQVIYNGKLASGLVVHTESKDKAAAKKLVKLQNHVPDDNTLRMFAQEKEYNMNYTGYEGSITAFLQPYCLPGYQTYIVDDRYPDLTGTYLIESTEVNFGIRGARRIAEIGPQVGFIN